jgi:hypothetical protein
VSRTAGWWGQWRGLARSGLVANWASRRAFRHAGVCCWWAGGLRRCHGVVTSGAKHGGTQGDTLRRLVQVNGGEGRSGTGKHGFSLTGGQVVAGSDPVSPTTVSPTKESRSHHRSGFVFPGSGTTSGPSCQQVAKGQPGCRARYPNKLAPATPMPVAPARHRARVLTYLLRA